MTDQPDTAPSPLKSIRDVLVILCVVVAVGSLWILGGILGLIDALNERQVPQVYLTDSLREQLDAPTTTAAP